MIFRDDLQIDPDTWEIPPVCEPRPVKEPDGIGRMIYTMHDGCSMPGWMTWEQLQKVLHCPGRIRLYKVTDKDGVERFRGWYRVWDGSTGGYIRKSIRLGELDAVGEDGLRRLVDHHNRTVCQPVEPESPSRLYKQLLKQRDHAWLELRYVAQQLEHTFYGFRFAKALKQPQLVCEPDWYWEILPPEPENRTNPLSIEEQMLRNALACRSKSAHAHEAHPEFAFDLLSMLIRQINDHLVVMIRRRFLDRHMYHAAMLLRYMDLHETLGLIEERDYRTGREFKTLRKSIRMNRGVDHARDRLGLEKLPEIPVPSWNEFVGEQLGELVELGQLANGEPKTGSQKSGGVEQELQRLAKSSMVARAVG